jgi:hypothetical protein
MKQHKQVLRRVFDSIYYIYTTLDDSNQPDIDQKDDSIGVIGRLIEKPT